jgi:murein DD-endopeptidase MepM/ murein hydrolase activator NlpD
MTNIQYPIDGKLGKDYKVTSPYGWRIHPIEKYKKHHNGVDLWSSKEPCYIEAIADGKVLEARMSTAAGGGYGYFVRLLHKIDGEWYTSTYAHMVAGSLKVKKGQTIKAGTILGKMGTTGASTGKHLHIEIQKGKTYAWTGDGTRFVEPLAFIAALIEKNKVLGAAPKPTPEDAPVAPAPVHGPKPVAAKPKPPAKPKTYKVKPGDTLGKIATANKTTVAKLAKLNNIKNVNLIRVGQVIKLG